MIRAILFDLYGTLLHLRRDSQPYFKLACRLPKTNIVSSLTCAMTDRTPSLSVYSARIGLPSQDDIPELEADLRFDIEQIVPFPDAMPTLVTLKHRGLLTAVVSNLATPYKAPFVIHKLSDHFDATVFSCDCGTIKPDPAIYRLALERLGAAPEETLMIGDSFKSDVEGPSKIGIAGIHLVRSGKSSRATRTVSSLEEISTLFRYDH